MSTKEKEPKYNIEDVKTFIYQAKTKKEVLAFFKAQSKLCNMLLELIKSGDIELLKKIPAQVLGYKECKEIINTYGEEGLNYIPAKKYYLVYGFYRDKAKEEEKTRAAAISYDDLLSTHNIINDLKNQTQSLAIQKSNFPVCIHKEQYSKFYAYYISDLHLDHKIVSQCNSNSEIQAYIEKKVKQLIRSKEDGPWHSLEPIFILGDTSCSFEVNSLFFSMLKKMVNNIIAVLGNHELWFKPYRDQIAKYENLFSSLGIHFLNNGLLFYKDGHGIGDESCCFSLEQLSQMTLDEIRDAVRSSRLIVFGGIGFAGKNKSFNAEAGIYRGALSRQEEIKESKKFESIYDKLNAAIGQYQVIVATHMPMADWSEEDYNPNWIYLSGHTHKNYFLNNENAHVYSDNQVGYKEKSFKFNHFNYVGDLNHFALLDDGIYRNIDPNDYYDFCFNLGIRMEYTSRLPVILIKKHGYYMFMRKHSKKYVILDGGKPNRAPFAPKYYYDHLDEQVEIQRRMMGNDYTKLQSEVAEVVRSIGGSGNIHGAIVDIDFFNHIYINPFDGTITPYYATNTIDKIVYDSMPDLLKERRKDLFKYLQDNNINMPAKWSASPKGGRIYLGTEMYKASKNIRSLQYLYHNNVVRRWIYSDLLLNDFSEDPLNK